MSETPGARHELKYIVSDGGALLLEKRLPLVLKTDRHAGADGRYTVRSLYFDDTELTALTDKLAGVDRRAKYRLRRYMGDPGYIAFEKKEKRGDLCFKSTARVSRECAEDMISGRPVDIGEPLLAEFEALRRASLLAPAVIVDYERAAFVTEASHTRVTLDLNVRASFSGDDFFSDRTLMLPVMEPGEQILEVKFDDFLPAQAEAVLQDAPRSRMAVSKYCCCLSALR